LSSELATSLPIQRPKRADAARNYDKLLAAAREAFTSEGEDASLEGIARRADVGIGTLYRNFPTRQALLEAVYIEEVEGICRAAQEFEDEDPWQALTGWLARFADYATTKKALAGELMAYMDEDSEVFLQPRDQGGGRAAPRGRAAVRRRACRRALHGRRADDRWDRDDPQPRARPGRPHPRRRAGRPARTLIGQKPGDVQTALSIAQNERMPSLS
jgi:AcrR family transcriptional regulator